MKLLIALMQYPILLWVLMEGGGSRGDGVVGMGFRVWAGPPL